MSEPDPHIPDGKTTIIAAYGLVSASIILCFIPITAFFMTGLILLPISLLVCWGLRLGKPHDSLIYNHMIYISRTIWMYSLLLSLTSSIAGFMVFRWADNSLLHDTLNTIMGGQSYSHEELYGVLLDYARANLILMISAAMICIVPVVGYITYRLSRGLSRALKGYRLPRPQAWF